jgi:5'-3' exonuclease
MIDSLIVDVSNVYSRAKYVSVAKLCRADGLPCGALYGFIRTVEAMRKRFEPKQVILCFDWDGAVWRREIYPEYKADRGEGRSLYQDPSHENAIYDWIRLSGYFGVRSHQYEADDLIAHYAKLRGMHVIVSSDHDFYQYLRQMTDHDYVRVIRGDAKSEPISYISFKLDRNYEPEEYWKVMVLTGDKSDNVSGVPGVGEKTAVKFLKYNNWKLDDAIKELAAAKKMPVSHVAGIVDRNKAILLARPVDMLQLDVIEGDRNVEYLNEFYELWEFRSLQRELEPA